MILKIYAALLNKNERLLKGILQKRLKHGKEDADRLHERQGLPKLKRPYGALIWLHAASVGEAQSALIIVNALLDAYPDTHIMVTTGTKSSAKRMQDALPERAFHQYIPLDHPEWVKRFLEHWKPDAVLWMESELWPNMLLAIKERNIPAALINARLSKKSLSRWRFAKNSIHNLLSCFSLIMAQSERDARNFSALGATHVIPTGNIKYSATPLAHKEQDLKALQAVIGNRPVIAFASTHDGEEQIIADTHSILENTYPDLLSIIIPRHPERGSDILEKLQKPNTVLRSNGKNLPEHDTKLYIADTLGEMGLFYRLASIAYVGRSLSKDGGGGHNPLEPALLNCAIIHGKNIQNLQGIYDDMQAANACISVTDADELTQKLEWLLSDKDAKQGFIERAYDFAQNSSHVIDDVMKHIHDMLAPIMAKEDNDAT